MPIVDVKVIDIVLVIVAGMTMDVIEVVPPPSIGTLPEEDVERPRPAATGTRTDGREDLPIEKLTGRQEYHSSLLKVVRMLIPPAA